jgi:GTP-binding protein EngB required for normal cell division
MSQSQRYEKYLEQINHICGDFRIDSLKPQVIAISEILQESDMINVALVGRFKSGKSSFINSIIGRNIMPVAVLPLTSVITYVRYGPMDKAEVRFLDGKTKDIAFNELADFVTEERNPKNVKQVFRVDLELSCLREYAGVQFVDTPGFGSVYIHNTLTSREWLPRVGIAFLVVSSGHPFSEEDILLLKELDTYTCEIVILLSKADLVSSKEAGEVTDFIQNQVRQHLNKDLRILPFSNKPGFESLRQEVYGFIQRTIADSYVQKSREIINHKFRSALFQCREYLLLAQSAANSAQESRQQLYQQLKQERQFLSAIQNEIRLTASDLKSRLQSDLPERFQEQRFLIVNRLTDELKKQILLWTGNFEKTSQAFQQWTKANLSKELETLSEEIGLRLSEQYLNIALASFSRVIRAFQDRLAKDIENALHTKFNGATFDTQVEKPEQLNVKIGDDFMTPCEIAWFLILMWLFRPLVNRYFIRSIPWEVEKNLYRLASQWFEVGSRSLDQMAQQAGMFIENEMATIENILAEAPDQQKEIEKAILELEAVKTGIS